MFNVWPEGRQRYSAIATGSEQGCFTSGPGGGRAPWSPGSQEQTRPRGSQHVQVPNELGAHANSVTLGPG